jgi:hypothetical protein
MKLFTFARKTGNLASCELELFLRQSMTEQGSETRLPETGAISFN